MTPLELRKRLLIAESDLNRAQLAADLAEVVAGTRSIRHGVGMGLSLATAALGWLSGLGGGSASTPSKRSRLGAVLRNGGVLLALWRLLRSR